MSQRIRVLYYRTINKGNLVGGFGILLDAGWTKLVINDMKLKRAKDTGEFYVEFPCRSYEDKEGQTKYQNIVDVSASKETYRQEKSQLTNEVMKELMAYIEEKKANEGQFQPQQQTFSPAPDRQYRPQSNYRQYDAFGSDNIPF